MHFRRRLYVSSSSFVWFCLWLGCIVDLLWSDFLAGLGALARMKWGCFFSLQSVQYFFLLQLFQQMQLIVVFSPLNYEQKLAATPSSLWIFQSFSFFSWIYEWVQIVLVHETDLHKNCELEKKAHSWPNVEISLVKNASSSNCHCCPDASPGRLYYRVVPPPQMKYTRPTSPPHHRPRCSRHPTEKHEARPTHATDDASAVQS